VAWLTLPVVEEPLELSAPDGTPLHGTLARPGAGVPSPAALLLNGSGPLDRDSNMPGQALDVAKVLASALAGRGVASLRYDKRGVGESGGTYLTTGFDEETADACAALESLGRAPAIDSSRLAIVGHSVGSTIAIRLGAARSDLAGVVLLAAAARRGEEVMELQSAQIAAALRGPARLLSGRFLRKQARVRRRLLASTGETARVGGADLPARWFREYMAYDPAADIARIECPVLAITGSCDLQVEPEDVARIGQLVRGQFTGATTEGLTHVLRTEEGAPGPAGYPAQLKRPVDPDLVEQIATWVAARGRDS
jgi:pimeloyl-ACP methyl ester carboxylesterase